MTSCHPTPAASRRVPDPGTTQGGLDADLPIVALVGRPNVGKTTLFARASRRFAESTNAPGTTVSIERRRVEAGGRAAWLVDLPGTLSLDDRPAGEDPAWRLLLDAAPDAILVVAAATDLVRHIPLILACRDLGLPVVVAANLSDEADARGVGVDSGRLSQLLAVPVHRTSGRSGAGVDEAVAHAVRLAAHRRSVAAGAASPHGTVPARIYGSLEPDIDRVSARIRSGRSLGAASADALGLGAYVEAGRVSSRGAATLELGEVLEAPRWAVAERWARELGIAADWHVRKTLADRVARWSVAPWPGIPLFIGVSAGAFLAMVAIGGLLSSALGAAWGATVSPVLTAAVDAIVPWPVLARTLLWGLDQGLLAIVSIGIPYVLTFYVLLAVLEDSGYLTSAAVLTDRLFNAVGLPGRAAIPLLAATGCNVPAIYGTRVLATRRERLIASFVVTLTPCSARTAVVIGALAPFAGPGAALAAFGVVGLLTFGGGWAANAMIPGRQPPLVLELAPIRRPVASLVARKAWYRFRAFAVSATPVMLAGSFVLGGLYESGLMWPLARLTDPVVVGWLGLPSVAGLALVFAFLRKELALQLLVTLAAVQLGAGAAGIGSFMTPAQLFVYAVVTSVSVPCVATLGALAGEHGWRPALLMSGGSLAIALASGGVIARLLGAA